MAVAGAYAKWRFIGVRRTGLATCPSAGAAWKASPLFAVTRRPQHGPAVEKVIDNLERFCVYELAAPGRAAGRRLPPPPQVGRDLVQVAPDVAALAASASDDLPAMTAALLNAQLARQAGMVQIPASVTSHTRLSYLDTQPDGDGLPAFPGKSGHGYTLAQIGAEVACGPAPAAGTDGRPCAQIATRLAMPRLRFDANDPQLSPGDWTHGGYLGLLSDLAQAIFGEVERWQAAGTPQHLVLNLSLGWDCEFGGCKEAAYSGLTPALQAVYSALQYAAECDVLVIAAAGNVSGGNPQGTGPVLPAAWEGRAPIPPEGTRLSGPLVYAVGAVQADGRRLGNMRPQAMPPRAAFGDHAVAADSGGGCQLTAQAFGHAALAADRGRCFLPALTGTSVGAAIVSAVAAVVWDVQPNLHRQEVMKLVTESGSSLGYRADFPKRADAPLPEARRVTLCAALKRACTGTSCGSSWVPPPGCEPTDDSSFPHSLTAAQAPFQARQPLDGSQFQATLPPPPCSSSARYYTEDSALTHPCPDEDSEGTGIEPYLCPQPALDPCPTCTAGPGGGSSAIDSTAPVSALAERRKSAVQQVRFARFAASATAAGGAGVAVPGRSPAAGGSWTLRLKIRDDWPALWTEPNPATDTRRQAQCVTGATLNLEVIDAAQHPERITYAIVTPLCAGSSIELSGIVIPAGATVESGWLSFLEHGVAFRSQLLVPQR